MRILVAHPPWGLPQLPAGQKFCKITQNRSPKKVGDREKLASVQPPIFAKSGRKAVAKLVKNLIRTMIFWSRNLEWGPNLIFLAIFKGTFSKTFNTYIFKILQNFPLGLAGKPCRDLATVGFAHIH